VAELGNVRHASELPLLHTWEEENTSSVDSLHKFANSERGAAMGVVCYIAEGT
jgi:hypothetical protein